MQLSIPIVSVWALMIPTTNAFESSLPHARILRKLGSRAIAARKLKSRVDSLVDAKRDFGRHLQFNDDFGEDDFGAALLDSMGIDPAFMACFESYDAMMESNPDLAELDLTLSSYMEDETNMSISATGNSIKAVANIPQEWQDSMSEACANAGGVLDKLDTFDCEFDDGIQFQYNGMASCLPDTDSCKPMANGKWYASLMDTAGIACKIGVEGSEPAVSEPAVSGPITTPDVVDEPTPDVIDEFVDDVPLPDELIKCDEDSKAFATNNPEYAAVASKYDSSMEEFGMMNMQFTEDGAKMELSADPEVLAEYRKACDNAGLVRHEFSSISCVGNEMGMTMEINMLDMVMCLPDTEACNSIDLSDAVASTAAAGADGLECVVEVSPSKPVSTSEEEPVTTSEEEPVTISEADSDTDLSKSVASAGAVRPWAFSCMAVVVAAAGILVGI